MRVQQETTSQNKLSNKQTNYLINKVENSRVGHLILTFVLHIFVYIYIQHTHARTHTANLVQVMCLFKPGIMVITQQQQSPVILDVPGSSAGGEGADVTSHLRNLLKQQVP